MIQRNQQERLYHLWIIHHISIQKMWHLQPVYQMFVLTHVTKVAGDPSVEQPTTI